MNQTNYLSNKKRLHFDFNETKENSKVSFMVIISHDKCKISSTPTLVSNKLLSFTNLQFKKTKKLAEW